MAVDGCPYCGQPLSEDLEVSQDPRLRFRGRFGRIFRFLMDQRQFGLYTSMDDLIKAVFVAKKRYPMYADGVIRVTIHRNRPRIRARGWDILGPKETGYQGYMLVKLDEQATE